MPEGISRRAFAKLRGISEAAVRKYIANGTLAEAVLPDGNIDPEAADRLLAVSLTRGAHEPVQLKTAKQRRLRARVRRLQDSVDGLRRQLVAHDDAAALVHQQVVLIATRLRRIPEESRVAAGMASQQAHTTLRGLVNAALEDLSSDDGPNVDGAALVELDLDTLTPAALAALQANLQAEEIELQRLLNHGGMLEVVEIAADFEERLAVAKSILVSMPGVVAPFADSSTADAIQSRVRDEVERAAEALKGNG